MSEVNIKTDPANKAEHITAVVDAIRDIMQVQAEQATIRAALGTFAQVVSGHSSGQYMNYDRGIDNCNHVSASVRE